MKSNKNLIKINSDHLPQRNPTVPFSIPNCAQQAILSCRDSGLTSDCEAVVVVFVVAVRWTNFPSPQLPFFSRIFTITFLRWFSMPKLSTLDSRLLLHQELLRLCISWGGPRRRISIFETISCTAFVSEFIDFWNMNGKLKFVLNIRLRGSHFQHRSIFRG